MLDIELAWDDYCGGNYIEKIDNNVDSIQSKSINILNTTPSLVNSINTKTDINNTKCTDLYISTTTKMIYLNTIIDLNKIFWKIDIIQYYKKQEGIIKKEMKFNSDTQVDLDNTMSKLSNYRDIMVDVHIIKHISNSIGRIKFKDVRKITIGLSKKDIISYRKKKKGAFINCFTIILRVFIKYEYKEFHIKVFNTGKIEIPGIQYDEHVDIIMKLFISLLNKYDKTVTHYVTEKTETILINSNFSCGFYINRNRLYIIFKNKYNINCSYDPCSYPGIQCVFYYDKNRKEQNGKQNNNSDIKNHDKCLVDTNKCLSYPSPDVLRLPISIVNDIPVEQSTLENNNLSHKKIKKVKQIINPDLVKVSFMIFRTGSILIVGRCSEPILYIVYNFIKNILINEKQNIDDGPNNEIKHKQKKTSKFVKKIITFNN
jgi:TATA-box binding protein (TBP) (component of TFIID and TFIIIB)